jgi:glycosyltransferase involved in cell wall biosynthesis
VILVDGVFWQALSGGIGRVWRMLLAEWARDGFGERVLLLDRGGAPDVPGIRRRAVPPLDYRDLDGDRARLQAICDEEHAQAFISTFHTAPPSTPSVILVHDMIPEVLKWNPEDPMWRDKHHGIRVARAHITVSQRSAFDLARFFPDVVRLDEIVVAHPGVAPEFAPAPAAAIDGLAARLGLDRPWLLVFAHPGGSYKNTTLFFRALAKLPDRERLAVLCAGVRELDPAHRRACAGMGLAVAQLSDADLVAAYSGALALAYPSAYEGFGLPLVEAMACGCPVIACPTASIPEVLGDAGLYVSPVDPTEMTARLVEVQSPMVRARCRERGLERAQRFSWARMAATVRDVLLRVAGQAERR